MQYTRLVLCLGALALVAQGVNAGGGSRLPARKSGLWEVTLRPEGPGPRTGQTVQQCTSAQAEPVMLLSILRGQEHCSEVKVARRAASAGGGYDIRTVCEVHDNPVRAQVVLRGDLQSAYTGTFEVKFLATPQNDTGRVAFEGRWLGACKPGQRPGDMVLPNGVTVNVVDDKTRAEAQGREGHGHAH